LNFIPLTARLLLMILVKLELGSALDGKGRDTEGLALGRLLPGRTVAEIGAVLGNEEGKVVGRELPEGEGPLGAALLGNALLGSAELNAEDGAAEEGMAELGKVASTGSASRVICVHPLISPSLPLKTLPAQT